MNAWPIGDSKILGFTGYKAGMTHCIALDETKGSKSVGTELFVPVTIIECPPMRVVGVRVYRKGYSGTASFTDIWCDTPSEKEVDKRANLPAKTDSAKRLAEAEKTLEEASEIRLIAYTKPSMTSAPKKIPDITELGLSGTVQEQFAHAREVLGKDITISDIFKEKAFIDVTSVTKGKGYGGVIKRYGVRKQPAKSNGKRRHPGTGGSWHPAHKLWVEPLPGQVGFHTRTEYNKLVLKVGTNGAEVSPAGGFLHYGPVKGDYLMLYGSVPGPAKRVVRLTFPRRLHDDVNLSVKHIDLTSKQGA